MHRFFLASTMLAMAIGATGCATVSAEGKLAEARTLLVEARTRAREEQAKVAIHDAEAAVEFAEFEGRHSPNDWLARERANHALDKARSALMACDPGAR